MSWVVEPYLRYKSVNDFVQDFIEYPEDNAKSLDLNWRHIFDGFKAGAWLNTTWKPVFILLAFYVLLVFVGQSIMANRPKIFNRRIVFYWNFGLATFSLLGFWYILPVALLSPHAGLLTVGLKASVCTNASWYNHGVSGFFVFLFVTSKTFELIDTVWLVLGKRPVIFLHWYHHITVLLFCWHAYAKAIPTGIWFALVNYGVHSVMYSYYACTQFNEAARCFARPFAPFITIVQTSQMVFGLIIIFSNMYFASKDPKCISSPTNNLIGLALYFSYFILFARIFINRFVFSAKRKKISSNDKCAGSGQSKSKKSKKKTNSRKKRS